MDVAVNTGLLSGFSSRPRTLAGLDPARPDRLAPPHRVPLGPRGGCPGRPARPRLVFRRRRADPSSWPSRRGRRACCSACGAGLSDRGTGTLRQGWGLLFPWRLAAAPLADARAVTLERVETLAHREGREPVRHPVLGRVVQRLRGPAASAGGHVRWEDAAPLAEAMARFLSLPLDDRSQDAIRRLEDLDRGLGEAAAGRNPAPSPARSGSEATRWRSGPTARSLSGSPNPATTPISPSAA